MITNLKFGELLIKLCFEELITDPLEGVRDCDVFTVPIFSESVLN